MSNPVDTAAIKAALSELIAEPWEYIEDDYAIVAPDLCIQDRIETHEFGRGIVLLRNTASSLVEELERLRKALEPFAQIDTRGSRKVGNAVVHAYLSVSDIDAASAALRPASDGGGA